MLGDDLHLTAVVGRQNLVSEADDFGMDVDWLGRPSYPLVAGFIIVDLQNDHLVAVVYQKLSLVDVLVVCMPRDTCFLSSTLLPKVCSQVGLADYGCVVWEQRRCLRTLSGSQ